MTLAVIGSGFGRTGTKSLKEALEYLGYGPCHHMHEILGHFEQVPHWQRVAQGHDVEWGEVFKGDRSQVDWPGAHFWRELAQTFPEAKVIHTVRPEESWWASFSVSIVRLVQNYREMPLPAHAIEILDAWYNLVGKETFDGRLDDKETALAAYRQRTRDVQEALHPPIGYSYSMSPRAGNPFADSLAHPSPKSNSRIAICVMTFGTRSAVSLREQ